MNKRLLQKVIDELAKDKPDLSYIRGVLETLMEMQEDGTRVLTNDQYASEVLKNGFKPELTLSAAEQAAMMAESGFIKGTNPGVTQHAPVISNG